MDDGTAPADPGDGGTAPVDPGDDAWFLAYSLRERLAGGDPAGPVDEDLGRIRLKMWQDEPVHARRPERMAAHLAEQGLDEAGLIRLLGEQPAAVRARFDSAPAYARRLVEAWQRYGDAPPAAGAADATGADATGFAAVVAPLVGASVERVRGRVADLLGGHPHLTADAVAVQLGGGPVDTINHLAARTLVLELNVLRVRGELAGDSPHERYHHFLHLLRRPAYALAVLREYPVLARDLVRAVDNWEASRLEFAERLVADYAGLAERCGGPDSLGDLAEVSFGAGDSHRGGRSVAVVRFATGARVVYKPRRLGVDRHFQELLTWLNRRGGEPALRTFWVLDRDGYGWTEFVAAGPCADRAALGRFYRRQGALLALLQVLGATDFHLENVIASGEDPMLIDLEAMLHNWQRQLPEGAGAGYLPREAIELMNRSVTAVGLLPAPVVWTEDNQLNRFDLSGMTGAGGQLTARPVAVWDGAGTDEMHLTRRRLTMAGADNLPALGESTPDVTEFEAEIVDGYRGMYRTLLAHRDALLAPAGPLAAFAHDEVRVVVRATETYMRLLVERQHPDLLRDALDRDRFHENLWAGHEGREHRDRLVAAELAQLRNGDVPIFVTTPSSTDLTGGDGSVLPGMLRRTGLDVVREQLGELSERHLAQQTWFIEASLTALVMDGPGTWRPRHGPGVAARPADGVPDAVPPDRFVDAARLVGDRLLATALTEDDRICWLGLNLVADKVWTLSPAGMDLYNGISGIALFLGYLARVTGDAAYRRGAERAAAMMAREAETWLATPPPVADVGAFGTLGGPVYALSHLAVALDRAELAETAAGLAELLVGRVADVSEFDVVAGSAGGLLAVLSLHRIRPDPALLDGARALAGHLLAGAERAGGGLAWRGAFHPAAALAGFSHGASGVATALSRLDGRAGTTDHRGTVDAALRFERSLYDERLGNWRDLREDRPGGGHMVAWCHGAAGVAMARAELLGYADDGLVREDLRRAVAAVLDARGSLHNHSLCHGELGNAEAVLAAARRLGDADLAREAATVAAAAVREVERGAWLCGVPRGVETPGLMSGLAGIGHALLRFADPAGVPSVLLLEPPPAGPAEAAPEPAGPPADHRDAIGVP